MHNTRIITVWEINKMPRKASPSTVAAIGFGLLQRNYSREGTATRNGRTFVVYAKADQRYKFYVSATGLLFKGTSAHHMERVQEGFRSQLIADYERHNGAVL